MKNERLVIVEGVRTPFCKMATDLARLGADELGRVAVNALLTRTGLDPNLMRRPARGCRQRRPCHRLARWHPAERAGGHGASQLRFRL